MKYRVMRMNHTQPFYTV